MRTIFLVFVLLFANHCFGGSPFVELSNVPADGFVVCPLDITPAVHWSPQWDDAEFFYDDIKLDAVFMPGDTPTRGTFVAVLPDSVPKGKPCRLRIENKQRLKVTIPESDVIVFDPQKHGGLPSVIRFADGKTLETQRWLDRLHEPSTGTWDISNDKDADMRWIVDKPFLKVARITAVCKRADGSAPPSKPRAQYQWFIFPDRELVYVSIFAQQDEPAEWKEKHFLELHIPDGSFAHWFGDDKSGTFTGTKQSQTFSRYAGFRDDSGNVIAVIAPGTVMYDGLNDFGPYLMPRGGDAWKPWADRKHRQTSWYWIGKPSEPVKTLQAAYEAVRSMPQATIVIPEFDSPKDWKTAAVNDLFLSGKIASREELEWVRNASGLPRGWCAIESDGLGMIVEVTGPSEDRIALGLKRRRLVTVDTEDRGLRLLALVDKQTNTVLSARESVPLFTVEVFDKETGETFTLTSDDGWGKVNYGPNELQFAPQPNGHFFLSNPTKIPEAEGLTIFFQLGLVMTEPPFPPSLQGLFRSHLRVYWKSGTGQNADRYEFRKITSPQIALRNLGPTMKTFYPYVSGVVTENPVGKELRWQGIYPSGWCSMQFTAVYDETKAVGLYVAPLNSGGSVKTIRLDADSAADSLVIRFEHPLPLPCGPDGTWIFGVLEPFRGDWYDAAMIYRDYVRERAQWYPREKLGPDGRTDTPRWMKELCVWAQCADPPEKMPETMRRFTEAFGIPTAVHWYNWHQVPFDNDYPHFFPAKDGFKEAVAEIQKNGDCFVMPYINGHLWDTRDKEMEDFQFTSIALPATAKKEDGKPYIETYGSKESDGSPVELAAMCPATDVWKNKVAENVLRLINECGCASVYVDQVAAAQPNLCFDKSHGHPLAGGDWWNREYWKMFEKIRSEMPKDKMLTTECNAEPFVNIFDGYLTWHFQYQDQVPAFAAVYGGAVQMFGRAYRGGPDQELADRMKAAQQLVYGEQIGWFDPRVIDDPKRFPFFKAVVRTRYKYRDYFYMGEMIRPPKLSDEIPTVTADWQWYGETIITTDAVFTGAWRKVDEDGKTVSAVFIFVNVSNKPITSRVSVRLDEIGLTSKAFDDPLTFEPGVPLTIEVLR